MLIESGKWTEAEDGYVVPIIYTTQMNTRLLVRVPMGTFAVYTNKSGETKWQKLYAQFANGDFYRINGVAKPIDQSTNLTVSRLVSLIIAGVHPTTAYAMARGKYIKSGLCKTKVRHILKTKAFRMELQNQLQPFKGKLKSKFTEDKIIKELESLIDNSRPGTLNHRENIKFIMELIGMIDSPVEKKRKAEEIPYEDVPPPQIQ